MHHNGEEPVLVISVEQRRLGEGVAHLAGLLEIGLLDDAVHVEELIELEAGVDLLASADEEVEAFEREEQHRRERGDLLPLPRVLQPVLLRVIPITPAEFLRSQEFHDRLLDIVGIEHLQLQHREYL